MDDLLFKGMTRPAMWRGIPFTFLAVSILVVAECAILSAMIHPLLSLLMILLGFPILYHFGQYVGKKDPFLIQVYLLKINHTPLAASIQRWSGISYTP